MIEQSTDAPTYTIRTVADFLLVPEDRLDECLREFRLMLDIARPSVGLLNAVADEMARHGEWEPGDVRFQVADRFIWIDDGKGDVTMKIRIGEDSDSAAPSQEGTP